MGTTTYLVSSESALDADITAINSASTSAPAGTDYLIVLQADLTLTANIQAIDLAAGFALTIEGANPDNDSSTALIDGDGSHRGFVVTAGTVALVNLDLQALRAPGGSGGTPGGGGALAVGAGASVTTNGVNFSGDSASGGTAAGGAVFVAAGGSLALAGGSLGGAGAEPGNGAFIQGNNSITLSGLTVTGAIADQTGAHLGTGAGTVIAVGAVTLAATDSYTGGTRIEGSLTLAAPGTAGSGAIGFAAASGETLVATPGDAPTNLIDGFVVAPSGPWSGGDAIDLQGIGLATGTKLAAGNHLTLTGGTGTVTLNLDPAQNYSADAFVLLPDAGATGGTIVQLTQKAFTVASEAAFNSALAAIDAGGQDQAPGVGYTITLTGGFTLAGDLDAVNLASSDQLVINGAGTTIDGAGLYRGLFAYAGRLTVENLTIQDAVAFGGAGGSGATPGGGGAGLGGGLFVASGATVTLANVSFAADQAIGGAAGATGVAGSGGGGGLGGAGGAAGGTAGLPRNGGGGGIGVAAAGGSAGAAGGAGIVIGAAGGNAGTGNRPAGGAGGGDGGGGGGAGITVTSGSGRGGGGSRTYPGLSGSGGVGGGFGGGAGSAEGAGFGGGGANGAGGWGGGGSGASAGGFGGGAAVAGGAGGGLGAGGAVFVQPGGVLTVDAGGVSGGGVAGGAGNGGGSGAALGGGWFLGGAIHVNLDPAAGQTLTVGNPIADAAGSGSLTLIGPGTVVLSVANQYGGGTTLKAGTLSLLAPGAAGSGAISFAYGAAATLIAGAGDVPANLIKGLLPGDSIDLMGIGTASSATLGAGDVLAIGGGTVPATLTLDPGQNFTGETFNVATDNHGGTWVTASDVGGDFPPFVSGTTAIAGDNHTPVAPLAGIAVSDLAAGKTLTVTVSLSSAVDGGLSNLGGGGYDAATGVYTVTGSTAAVTAALRGLVFTPKIHQVAPGGTVTTTFYLSATDGVMTSPAAREPVRITALNDPPVIAGVPGNLVEGYWNVALKPFPTASVTDPDAGAKETVTFGLGTNIGGTAGDTLSLSLPGMTLTSTGGGGYALSPGTPAQVSAALQALQFTGVPDASVPGYTITYVGMSVSDGIAAPVTAQAEVLTGLPIFAGTAANQTVTDGQTIDPFSTVAVTDSAGLTIQGFSIILYDSSSDYLTPTDANGTLSGAGLTQTGVGSYTLAAGSTAAVSAELDKLVFTPAVQGAAVTTDFLLSAFDGATTADNSDTSVTAAPATASAIVGAAMLASGLAAGGMAFAGDGGGAPPDAIAGDFLASPNPAAAAPWLAGAGAEPAGAMPETAPGGAGMLAELNVTPDTGWAAFCRS